MHTNRALLHKVPEKIRTIIGTESSVCLLNGRDVMRALASENLIVMGCNPRIKHVIPGIMRAAEELDAVLAFELTRTEGGVDGGYTGQTPEMFVRTVLEYAEQCRFTRPFFIHGDHITILDTTRAEIAGAQELLDAQPAAGFTSFAFDASFNPLPDNIAIVSQLAQRVMEEGYGLEVELGEVRHSGSESNLTTVAETGQFLTALAEKGVYPDLLAINNGSKSGNYLEGEMVRIDLDRTREIYETAKGFGLAGLVQHGITGTPLRIVGKLADYGIRKGNIGTLWQNVAHAGLPPDLVDAMRQWAKDNCRDLKHATGAFKSEIDAIPDDCRQQIIDMAYHEAREFLVAFHAKGSGAKLAAHLLEAP
jgi:fructose-bisphosphate aldolase class II